MFRIEYKFVAHQKVLHRHLHYSNTIVHNKMAGTYSVCKIKIHVKILIENLRCCTLESKKNIKAI